MTEHTPTPGLRTDTTDEVAERYCDDLLLALRTRDVPGNRIGEVLAEVRDHLASSGEDPVDAFGTPQDYADALTAGHGGARRSARALATAGNAAGVAGLLWTVAGATALLTRQPAVLTEFQIVLPVAVAVAAPLLIETLVTARRGVRRRAAPGPHRRPGSGRRTRRWRRPSRCAPWPPGWTSSPTASAGS